MADLSRMKNAVSNLVSQAIYDRTKNQKARRGIVRGGSVVIGEKVLPFAPAVDMFFKDGDAVWCIISDNGMAVVVGV
ncbi:hypothetical protein [Selenomonas sp. AB3002]|uniref:hypothetical protein n=1 Tax=Selenomonas sp. AB3002 TaxID=1392502 RepID=UPI000497DBC1